MTLAFPISISLSVKGSRHIFFDISRNYGKTNSTIFASVVRRLGKGSVDVGISDMSVGKVPVSAVDRPSRRSYQESPGSQADNYN
jgi:hypothetical protein